MLDIGSSVSLGSTVGPEPNVGNSASGSSADEVIDFISNSFTAEKFFIQINSSIDNWYNYSTHQMYMVCQTVAVPIVDVDPQFSSRSVPKLATLWLEIFREFSQPELLKIES